jgi:hypothetical protein
MLGFGDLFSLWLLGICLGCTVHCTHSCDWLAPVWQKNGIKNSIQILQQFFSFYIYMDLHTYKYLYVYIID